MTSRAAGSGARAADGAADAREAFGRRDWAVAYAGFAAADLETPLPPADVERLAIAAQLTGREDAAELWERAHRALLAAGDIRRAALTTFWLGMVLIDLGEHARGGGWIARGQRLLDEGGDECTDCVERGYLMVPAAIQLLFAGDPGALAAFGAVADVAARFGDADLTALSRLGIGQIMIRSDRPADGVAMLDEAMLAVTAGETSSIVAGLVYCAVITSFQAVYDIRRAQEWTAALTRWCDAQPGLVPYRGQCMVHRSQILQVHGAWTEAVDSARQAIDHFSAMPSDPAVGMAFQELGELARLRGEFDVAEEAYREASRRGHDPQPGLALLRLAQGQPSAAAAALRRALDEAQDPLERPRLLAALVEIALAADDVAGARAAADELANAASAGVPWLRAVATCARGAVLLAGGDPRDALVALRPAWSAWQDLEAPYEAARVRVLVGLACRQLGDEDTAKMEFDAARWVFDQLGAAPDLARVTALMQGPAASGGSSVLTPREVEVLRVVAAGKTNRAIAADLFLSEKTVARHVSNILAKLALPSRAAATAWAYEHDLI